MDYNVSVKKEVEWWCHFCGNIFKSTAELDHHIAKHVMQQGFNPDPQETPAVKEEVEAASTNDVREYLDCTGMHREPAEYDTYTISLDLGFAFVICRRAN